MASAAPRRGHERALEWPVQRHYPILVKLAPTMCRTALWHRKPLLYAGAVAVGVHLFVIWYEEPVLRAQFGDQYDDYRHNVSRWIPRPPRRKAA